MYRDLLKGAYARRRLASLAHSLRSCCGELQHLSKRPSSGPKILKILNFFHFFQENLGVLSVLRPIPSDLANQISSVLFYFVESLWPSHYYPKHLSAASSSTARISANFDFRRYFKPRIENLAVFWPQLGPNLINSFQIAFKK